MDGEARKRFFMTYLPGLLPLTTLYVLLTAYRDFQDNFCVDIWKDLGFSKDESAALGGALIAGDHQVLVILAFLAIIKDNGEPSWPFTPSCWVVRR